MSDEKLKVGNTHLSATSLQLKKRYKQTEVGVIPVEWDVKKIIDISPLQRGFDLPTTQLKKGIYPVVYSNGILNHHLNYKVKAPGVVTGRSGTIGKVTFVSEDYWPHNTSLWVTDFKGNDPRFVYYLFDYIKLEKFGTGSGVPTLNRNDVHALKIPLPHLCEQRVIAKALSDVDALISKLNALIIKKRNLKQGAMQQLLTGKKRLPGFTEKWEVKKLGEMGIFSKGKGLSKQDITINGNIPAIPYTAIYTDFNEIIAYDLIDNFTSSTQTAFINSPHILIAGSSNMLENIGKVSAFNGFKEVAIGGDIILYKTIANVCFISYLLNTESHRKKIISLSQGSTIRHVYASTFANYEIKLPEFKEQQAIAKILIDMDSEIDRLEQKLDKKKLIKQGMMQALLTGKTRLI